jgi:hypothetical protein
MSRLPELDVGNYFHNLERTGAEEIARKRKAPVFRPSTTMPGYYVVTYLNGDAVKHTLFTFQGRYNKGALYNPIQNNKGRVISNTLELLKSNIQRIIDQSIGEATDVVKYSSRYIGETTEDDAITESLNRKMPIYFKDAGGDMQYKVAYFGKDLRNNVVTLDAFIGQSTAFQSTQELNNRVNAKIKNISNTTNNNNNPRGGRRKTLRRKNQKTKTRKH